ncbi:LuxE/PaaK family acyltransferase [Rikenella microfusus]
MDIAVQQERIFSDTASSAGFESVALEIFRFQAAHCEPYRQYIGLLGIDPSSVSCTAEIPYLPVEFFKTRRIWSAPADSEPETVFTSSGTSGAETSRHYVASTALYDESFTRGFEYFYGPAGEWSIFALLPSYMERSGSSLVWMAERLQARNRACGGFYLYDHGKLTGELRKAAEKGEKILLIGVAFALLDYAEYLSAENIALELPEDAVVMETGGMKGRRREVSRETMHETLTRAFGVKTIHSEYGMTELLSQAYSSGGGLFRCPPWMRVSARDLQIPLRAAGEGEPGGLNVIDLANLWSCSFVAVQDRGIVYGDGSFRVLGRIEGAQLRGCNMLIE